MSFQPIHSEYDNQHGSMSHQLSSAPTSHAHYQHRDPVPQFAQTAGQNQFSPASTDSAIVDDLTRFI